MRTILPRRSGLLLVLTLLLGAPSLASAQLLPNLPIRRERPDCSQENPQYRVIRQEYWGYYPTCWRKFPPGWGCPSPEAPNWQREKQARPLAPLDLPPAGDADRDRDRGDDTPPRGDDRMPGDRNPPDAPPRNNDTGVPPLPNDTNSPFDPSPKPPAGSGGARPSPASGTDRPAPPPGGSADAPPTIDTPKTPGASLPSDVPATTAAPGSAPARRGRLVAGLFGRKR